MPVFKRACVSDICNDFTKNLDKVVTHNANIVDKNNKKADKITDASINLEIAYSNLYKAITDFFQKLNTKAKVKAFNKVNKLDEETTGAIAEAHAAEVAIGNVKKMFGQ